VRPRTPGGQHRTDAVDGGKSAAGGSDDLGHPGGVVGDPGINGAYVGDQVTGELLAGLLGGTGGTDSTQQRGGLVGGQLGRGAAGQQVPQEGV
jgi:hypothetical protein